MRANCSCSAMAALAAVTLSVAACSDTTANDTGPRSHQTPSPSPAEDWGPLAVVPSGNAVPDHTVFGTLQIGEECVTFKENEDALLIWPSKRVDWNPDGRTITLENEEGKPVTLQDGDAAHFVGLEKNLPNPM